MMRRVDGIEAAFQKVRFSALKVLAGDRASKDASFEEIFALNNAIGLVAREQPEARPRMKELQAYVNMITVGLKYDRPADLREGLSATEESIKALKKEFSDSR